jgi:hypothetical protein
MFDLEQSVAKWRRQMLAAGIKTPVPLEELESHLREETERQAKSGLNTESAFEAAVRQVGQPPALRTEFAKNHQFPFAFNGSKRATINQILAVCWFAQCAWFLATIASSPVVGVVILHFPNSWPRQVVLVTLFCSVTILGSYLLFFGKILGGRIIQIAAILELLVGVAECLGDPSFFMPYHGWVFLSIFSVVTVLLLTLFQCSAEKTATHKQAR